MKDIFQLMESSCGSYLKKIIGSFTSIALAEFLICWENKRYYVFRYEKYKFSV